MLAFRNAGIYEGRFWLSMTWSLLERRLSLARARSLLAAYLDARSASRSAFFAALALAFAFALALALAAASSLAGVGEKPSRVLAYQPEMPAHPPRLGEGVGAGSATLLLAAVFGFGFDLALGGDMSVDVLGGGESCTCTSALCDTC